MIGPLTRSSTGPRTCPDEASRSRADRDQVVDQRSGVAQHAAEVADDGTGLRQHRVRPAPAAGPARGPRAGPGPPSRSSVVEHAVEPVEHRVGLVESAGHRRGGPGQVGCAAPPAPRGRRQVVEQRAEPALLADRTRDGRLDACDQSGEVALRLGALQRRRAPRPRGPSVSGADPTRSRSAFEPALVEGTVETADAGPRTLAGVVRERPGKPVELHGQRGALAPGSMPVNSPRRPPGTIST